MFTTIIDAVDRVLIRGRADGVSAAASTVAGASQRSQKTAEAYGVLGAMGMANRVSTSNRQDGFGHTLQPSALR